MKKLLYQSDFLIRKTVSRKMFWIFFCGIGFFFPIYRSLNRELPPPAPVYFKIPTFSLIDENGKNFGNEQLHGKIFVANFIFTSCPSTCPKLTQEMQLIQKRVRGLGNKVALVSFSVDPETDTPEKLFKYARKMKANPYIWHFLTGDQNRMEDLVIRGFKVPMGEKTSTGGSKLMEESSGKIRDITLIDIAHTEKFVLVDGEGRVRGFYSPQKVSIDQMMIDIGLLVNRG